MNISIMLIQKIIQSGSLNFHPIYYILEMQKQLDWSNINLTQNERKALLTQFAQSHKYSFIDRIQGTNPEVYVFRVIKNPSPQQYVAKLVKIQKLRNKTQEEQAKHERQLLNQVEIMKRAKKLGFDGAVMIYDSYEVKVNDQLKYLVIVMEELKKILYNELPNFKNLSVEFRKKACLKLVEVIYQLHSKTGIVHRDLKPENIGIDADYKEKIELKLIDFGISNLCQNKKVAATTAGRGTSYYRAPEIREDSPDNFDIEEFFFDYTSDYWGLGVVLLEMFIGRKLSNKFIRDNVILQAVNKQVTDEELKKLIKILLQYSPKQRRKAEDLIEKISKENQKDRQIKLVKSLPKISLQEHKKKKQQQKMNRASALAEIQQKKIQLEVLQQKLPPNLFTRQIISVVEVPKWNEKQEIITQTIISQKVIKLSHKIVYPDISQKIVPKIVMVNQQKKQPKIVEYIIEQVQTQQSTQKQFLDVDIPVEILEPIYQINTIKQQIKLFRQVGQIEVNPQLAKAEKQNYPISLKQQVLKMFEHSTHIKIRYQAINQLKYVPIQIIQDMPFPVECIKETPIFKSEKTGLEIPTPSFIKLFPKKVKKLVNVKNIKQVLRENNVYQTKYIFANETIYQYEPKYKDHKVVAYVEHPI